MTKFLAQKREWCQAIGTCNLTSRWPPVIRRILKNVGLIFPIGRWTERECYCQCRQVNVTEHTYIELYQQMHSSLEAEIFQTFEAFMSGFMITNFDEYLQVLPNGISRPIVFLLRSMNDIRISPFNSSICKKKSNMDLQFILDEYSCAAYVAEHVNKSERGFSNLYRELIRLRDQFPDMDYGMCLKELGKRCLNTVEMCSQEAAWHLLRLPMSDGFS